jgi:hypothetical protein
MQVFGMKHCCKGGHQPAICLINQTFRSHNIIPINEMKRFQNLRPVLRATQDAKKINSAINLILKGFLKVKNLLKWLLSSNIKNAFLSQRLSGSLSMFSRKDTIPIESFHLVYYS